MFGVGICKKGRKLVLSWTRFGLAVITNRQLLVKKKSTHTNTYIHKVVFGLISGNPLSKIQPLLTHLLLCGSI